MKEWRVLWCLVAVGCVASLIPAEDRPVQPGISEQIVFDDGRILDVIEVPGGLPPAVKMAAVAAPAPSKAAGINILAGVPAFDWSYGCSATSAAMLAGYYDNAGYPNMYIGPANGGDCPMDNATWGYGKCPLSATEQGVDGLATRGHVDDYWVSYGNESPDPYVANGWPQHTHEDCTGDFMKTNQSAYDNSDGSTKFYHWNDGSPFSWSSVPDDGGYGLQLFLESRGYTVTDRFNQYIDEMGLSYGFSFAEFRQEIDAGRPVLVHVVGHTMLGFGYNTTGSLVYLHDTWDHSDHQMTWAGSYAGMTHYAVTVVRLADNSTIFTDGFESSDTDEWTQNTD